MIPVVQPLESKDSGLWDGMAVVLIWIVMVAFAFFVMQIGG